MHTTRSLPRLASVCSVLCLLCAGFAATVRADPPGRIPTELENPSPASANEVQWRSDYNKARREAEESGRPLFLDFRMQNCPHCDRLEQYTFRDPSIVPLLNQRFIPLRLDQQDVPRLVEVLRIQVYPTLVFARADGHILGLQEGYVEAAPLKERLDKMLAAIATTPDWMARDFQEAQKAMKGGDYTRALALFKGVVEDGKNRPEQVRAREMMQKLEQQAAERCAHARQLAEKGQVSAAVKTVAELVKVYAGTVAASEGGKMLVTLTSRDSSAVQPSKVEAPRPEPQPESAEQQRARQARDLLKQAREELQGQLYVACLGHCDLLVANYGDLPEAADATQLIGVITGNAESAKKACQQMSERMGALYLALAETMLKKGEPQQAIHYLERIVRTFPNSRQAEAAQVRLSQIQVPTRSTEAKK